MERRLKPVRKATFVAIGLALLAVGPSLGWGTLAPLCLTVLAFLLADHRLDEAKRPEYRIAAAWVFAQLMIGVSIALTGGADSPAVTWLAIPAVTLGARFQHRGMSAGALLTTVIMAGVLLGTDALTVAESPEKLLFPLVLLASIIVLSTATMRSDRHYRAEAVLDPLTRLLNRHGLGARFEELAEQARVNGESVGVIVADIDHFKAINDEHGHSFGDDVLREIATTFRANMRAFDLIYRLGGEEFIILLPGASLEQSRVVAERLRCAISVARPRGVAISMSLGVSASAGGVLTYEDLFAIADSALYEAKRAGRNRVAARSATVVKAAESSEKEAAPAAA